MADIRESRRGISDYNATPQANLLLTTSIRERTLNLDALSERFAEVM
jgi:hypothetical protein